MISKEDKKKSCGKIVFRTMEEAKEGAKRTNHMIRKNKQGGGKLVYYKCGKCNNYHLTKKGIEYSKIGMSDKDLEIAKKKQQRLKANEMRTLNGISDD